MGLFEQLGQQPAQQQRIDPKQAQQAFQSDLASLKENPVAYAKAHGKTLPEGVSDPNQMIQYLLKSTQVNNPMYQMAVRLLGGMRGNQ